MNKFVKCVEDRHLVHRRTYGKQEISRPFVGLGVPRRAANPPVSALSEKKYHAANPKAPVILTERSEWKDLGTQLTANAKIPRLANARSG